MGQGGQWVNDTYLSLDFDPFECFDDFIETSYVGRDRFTTYPRENLVELYL